MSMMGFPLSSEEETYKKFNSEECLNIIIEKIKEDPSVVRGQLVLHGSSNSIEQLNSTFMPATLDPTNWTRISTRRPKGGDEECVVGTDKEVRTYENDVWIDSNHKLEVVITTEFGEVKEIIFNTRW